MLINQLALGQSKHDRRHQRQEGHLVFLDQLEEFLHVKPRHTHHGCATCQSKLHDHDHAVDMKKRQHCQNGLILAHSFFCLETLDLTEIGHQIVVGEHYTLGQACRTAGIRQDNQIVTGIDIDTRRVISG